MKETKFGAESLVALERYLIDDLESSCGKAFLNQCRSELATNGCCNLNGFLRPQAVSALGTESNDWEADAYEKSIQRNPYHGEDDPSATSHERSRYAWLAWRDDSGNFTGNR